MPAPNSAEAHYIANRVNMPTVRDSNSLGDVPAAIRARAFFSARVAEAHILDRMRDISDRYSRGEIGLGEARNTLKDFLIPLGKDDGTESLKNLASTARLNLILEQNKRQAEAVGQYEEMYDPDIKAAYPFVIYHASVGSRNPRGSHQKFDGLIVDKDDPWLLTHTPPWEFGCNCELENCTAARAGKNPDRVKPKTPMNKVTVESSSGYRFDPAHAFDFNDITGVSPMSRAKIIEQTEQAVKSGTLDNVGIIVRGEREHLAPVEVPHADEVRDRLKAAQEASVKFLRDYDATPDILPPDGASRDEAEDGAAHTKVNSRIAEKAKTELGMASNAAKSYARNIPKEISDKIPDGTTELGRLDADTAQAAALPELPITLDKGDGSYGITHLWTDHKDLFLDPDKAMMILRETIGDPNCRVIVSLKQGKTVGSRMTINTCAKRLVLHNQKTRSYCVLRLAPDGRSWQVVSFNRAPDSYGVKQWALK